MRYFTRIRTHGGRRAEIESRENCLLRAKLKVENSGSRIDVIYAP